MVKNDCCLKLKPVTTRNPQANAIIKHVHQTIGNIIRILNVQAMDSNDPWTGTLAAATFAAKATTHHAPRTTLQAWPMQLVFGRDAILNVKHTQDWEHVRQRKQSQIDENDRLKNLSRCAHDCSLGGKVALVKAQNSRSTNQNTLVPRSRTQMTMAWFPSRKEVSMMQQTSIASNPFTNESQFQIACCRCNGR
jgi:hypothetical protein